MDMVMQQGHKHAASIDIDNWTYSMDMGCSIDIGMQYGHGHAAGTWTCSIDMGMQHGQFNMNT